MMHEEKEQQIVCDECGYVIMSTLSKKNEIVVKSQVIQIGKENLTLVYFTCPKCNRIYKIRLQDARYYELEEDLEKMKKRVQRNRGRNNIVMYQQMVDMCNKKLERFKNHVDSLNAKFSGTFTFDASENKTEDDKIIYLP